MTADQDSGAAKPARRPRWMFYALVASLAVNILVAGGLATAAWRFHHHGPHAFGHGRDGGLASFLRKLPSEKRDVLRGDLAAVRQKLRPLREEVRSAWQKANDVIAADPYDQAAAKAAFAELAQRESQFREAISEALINAAAKLTPAERVMLRDWREKRKNRRARWRGGRRGETDEEAGSP